MLVWYHRKSIKTQRIFQYAQVFSDLFDNLQSWFRIAEMEMLFRHTIYTTVTSHRTGVAKYPMQFRIFFPWRRYSRLHWKLTYSATGFVLPELYVMLCGRVPAANAPRMHCSLRLIVQTLVSSRSYLHRQVSPPETLVVKGGTTWARNGR